MKIKVMTYNICSGKDFRLDGNITPDGDSVYGISACAELIKSVSPDICGINEINEFVPAFTASKTNGGTPDDQAAYLAEATGLCSHAFCKAISFEGRGDYGNAVISKHSIAASKSNPIPNPEVQDEFGYYEDRAVGEVKIDLAGGITVLQTHLGLNDGEKQNGICEILKILDRIDTPVILMGDFNMRPHDWRLDRIRERLTDITPDGEGYIRTFPSWNLSDAVPEKLKSLNHCKIDYIFVSHHFRKISCEVLDARASDHKPMLAVLEI